MANIKSAIKRQKQNLIRRERNSARRSRVKTYIKAFRNAVTEGDADKAKALLPVVTREIHKAVTKGILHKNNGSRKVSRLSFLYHSMEKGSSKS